MEVNISEAAWAQETARGWEPAKGQTIIYFYDREVQNQAKSLEAGRPIFDMQCFIKKIPPGDKLLEVDRKATREEFLKFPRQYEAYQKKVTMAASGTPLEAWPLLARNQVAEMKALNIFTVEQLAGLPDQYGTRIMGFQGFKQKAQNFLRAAAGSAEFERMEGELRKRDEEAAELRKQMADMQAQMARLAENQKRRPGRPRRDEKEAA